MRFSVVYLVCFLCLFSSAGSASAKARPLEYDAGRNRLIAYMLSHQLPAQHFGHKALDNDLSEAAFELYLQFLDPRKRFLLRKDVSQLNVFTDKIDEELSRGLIVLPDTGASFLSERVGDVSLIIDQLMDAGFDPNREDYLELDPEKKEYAASVNELRERWRRSLKLQVISQYLDFVELETKKTSNIDTDEFAGLPAKMVPFNDSLWQKSMTKIRDRNHRYLKRLAESSRQEHYNRYFDVVARAFDPHTSYMAPTFKEDFDIHMRGSLEGIGALLREDEGYIKVVRIIPGSAAERQGQLQAEDIIVAVSEKKGEPVDMIDMRIREAVSYIRGPKGTEVRLTVQKPDGLKLQIPIIRDVVQIDETYVKSEVLQGKDGKDYGYVSIPSFYRDFESSRNGKSSRNVTDDLKNELNTLKDKGVEGLIIDVRNNGGGSLSDSVEISGLFLPGGPVLQVKNSQGKIRILEDTDPAVQYNGPVIVLVNKFSASASEILAAALQDYGRALIIGGSHTHGKGTVQALMDMNRNLPLLHLKKYDDLGALKVTIQKFYRVNGQSTQYKGVEPDIVVPSFLEYLETGEKHLDNSLPWDRVDSLEYQSWQGPTWDKKKALAISSRWVKVSEKFKEIEEETLKAKQRSKKTLTPVFIEQMYRERRELAETRAKSETLGKTGDHLNVEPGKDKEKNKKGLREQLSEDPYVHLSLALLANFARENPAFRKRR